MYQNINRFFVILLLTTLSVISCKEPLPEKQQIKEGESLPSMTFLADDGSRVSTENFMGQWTVLYFYPKDDSPGCTTQAKTFTSLLQEYDAANAKVYGINTDTIESHINFKKKHDLKVTLLTDPDGETASRFGIRIVAGLCARDSVLLNPEGSVEKIYRGVDPAGNPVEILDYIKSKQ